MATAAQTIEALAPAFEPAGLTLGSLGRTMRALKEADGPELVPKSMKGGGKGRVDLQSPHLVNFGIAIMAADTITQAAAVVPIYRALIPVQKKVVRTEVVGDEVIARSKTYERWGPTLLSSMLPWEDPPDIDLGKSLEIILRKYDAVTAEIPIAECVAWRVRPWVEITFRISDDVTETYAYGPAPDLLAPLSAWLTWSRPPGACFSMPVAVFKTLAELAHDGAHGQQTSSNEAGGTASKDTKTTTPATGGTGPASTDEASQPGVDPVKTADSNNQQDSDERERGQSPAPSSSLGSPSSDQTDQLEGEILWPRSNLRTQSAA
jgi:hypothetical protein